MKRSLACTTAIIASTMFAGSALAADPMPIMVTPPPLAMAPTPAPSWAGFYIGAFGGVIHGDADYVTGEDPEDDEDGPEREFTSDLGGIVAGIQAGYNFQSGNLVFGIVADAAWSNVQGTITVEGPPGIFQTDIDYLATLRARAGVLVGENSLLYVHGGLAVAGVSWASGGNVVAGPDDYPGPWSDGIGSARYLGYVVGAGFEHKLSENVSLFLEYGYLNLGSQQFSFFEDDDGEDRLVAIGISGHQLRAGINIAF